MKRLLVVGIIAVLMGSAFGSASRAAAQGVTVSGIGPAHILYEPGHQSANGSSPLVTWHHGPIMPNVVVYTIFWGQSWPTYTGDKITGINSFYQGFGGSDYARTVDEYYGTNGYVTPNVTFGQSVIDPSMSQRHPNAAAVFQEVGNVAQQYNLPLVSNGFYAVYGDLSGTGDYCAWHDFATVNGVTIQVAWFPNVDAFAGCNPQDTQTGHSAGLASLADSSAHELSEARTDPTNGGWFDNAGTEVADACNDIYPAQEVYFPSNGTYWKIQGEWSNNAYNAGTGYPNAKGYPGCIVTP